MILGIVPEITEQTHYAHGELASIETARKLISEACIRVSISQNNLTSITNMNHESHQSILSFIIYTLK